MTSLFRVCVVAACPVPFPRGTPVRVTRLSEALARMGHDVHLVTYGAGAGNVDPGVRVHRTKRFSGLDVAKPGPSPGKLILLDPLLALLLRRVLREHAFDLLHAHHYEGLLVARSVAGRRIPIVYDAHTLLETELPYYAKWLPAAPKRSLGRAFDHFCPRRARFVVTVSDLLRDRLVEAGAVSPDRIGVVGNGVDVENRPPLEPPAGPNGDEAVIIYAGNLAEYQGIDHLLRAFRRVVDRRPASRLRILTRSSFEPFEPLARELAIRDRIEIRAVPLSALHAELARAHVAVNPRPQCEGVPQKNLNYMAASTALVAFAGSIHPCADGESGVAVRPVSGEALGDAILALLDRPDDRVRMGRAARASLERDYTWQHQARRVTAIYERVLSR